MPQLRYPHRLRLRILPSRLCLAAAAVSMGLDPGVLCHEPVLVGPVRISSGDWKAAGSQRPLCDEHAVHVASDARPVIITRSSLQQQRELEE